MANDSARELAGLLPADHALHLLITDLISDAEATPPRVTRAQVEAWATTHREAVVAVVSARLPALPGMTDRIPSSPPAEGWHPQVSIGLARLSVHCDVATIAVDGDFVPIGLLPPSGASIALNAGPVSGSGALALRDNGASGSLVLRMGVADVMAFANLVTGGDLPSLTLVLGIRFIPPIQLSFGFALSAIGGVIAINGGLDADALRTRLADGSALEALFPTDPQTSYHSVLTTLGQILQPRPGHHVIGPTVTITWLDLGAFSIVRLDVGVLIAVPSATIVIVGRAQIQLPPVVQIRLDVVGVIDPGRSLIAIDAVLVDSHLLGIFGVTGTAAVRMAWGDRPHLVITVGGFYPGFHPEPALLPPQQRLGLHLAIPCPLTFRADGYLAITANTVQAGAYVEAGFDLDIISAHGAIKFDSIVTFDPFHIHADFSAEWHVGVAIFEGGTTVSGWIDGPGPWKIHARVSVSLLFDDFDWSNTFTFGPPGPPERLAFDRITEALERHLDVPSRFAAASAADPLVQVVERSGVSGVAGAVVASPLADLTWTQDVVPLDLPVRRAGGQRLAFEQSVSVAILGAVRDHGPATGWFAPTVFTDLTDAEALGQPTYQSLPAGRRLTLAASSEGIATATLEYTEHFKTLQGVRGPNGAPKPFLRFDQAVLQCIADQGAVAKVGDLTSVVKVSDEVWAVTHNGNPPQPQVSAIHALTATRRSGGILHALADRPITVVAL